MVFLLLVLLFSRRTPYFIHYSTQKTKAKGTNRKKIGIYDISHVALASLLLGENPSEEVDDYDNYYYYYYYE